MENRLTKTLWLLRTAIRNNLADGLSFTRIPFAALVFLFAYHSEWVAAAVLLGVGWLTDSFDGKVARRFGSFRTRHPGSNFDADGIGDFVLEITSATVVAIYLWRHFSYGWVAPCVLVLSLISGGLMVIMMGRATPTAQKIIGINMLIFHGLLNIGFVVCWFAYMACRPYGRWGVVVTLELLVVTAIWQRRKIRLWLEGRLS